MLKRMLTLSAAFVLLTGFAATAHADRVVVANTTGQTINVAAIGVKYTPTGGLTTEKSLIMKKDDKPKMINFGTDNRLLVVSFGCPDIGNVAVVRKPKAEDHETIWMIAVRLDEQGKVAYHAAPKLKPEM